MKEKDAKVDFEPHQLILYVEKEDGSYGPVQTGSYISANYLDDFWEKMKYLRLQQLEKLKSNEISPVQYFRMIHDFSDFELAKRVGLPLFKVKRHQKPRFFRRMKLSVLKRYADVFDIPVNAFFQIMALGNNETGINPEKSEIQIHQKTTANPFVVLTKIERVSDDN